MKPQKTILFAALALTLLVAGFAPMTARALPPALIYVVHGINGLDMGQPLMQYPLDVSISGVGCVLSNFMFMRSAGPISVEPGNYTINFSPASATPCSNPAILTRTFFVEYDKVYTVVAHLDAGGAPTASQFWFDVSHTTSDNGKSRFTIVNAAWGPTVDAYAKLKKKPTSVKLSGLTNGGGITFQGKAGNLKLWFTPTGSSSRLYGPMDMKTAKFHHYFIALVGSATNGYYSASFSVNTYHYRP